MKIYRKDKLTALLGISKSTLDRMVRAGLFPSPLRLHARAVGWPAEEVEAWLEQRRKERDLERSAG